MQNHNAHYRIAKWGTSLALRIPAKMAKALGLAEGGKVDLTVKNGCLVIAPVPGPTLEALVKGITPENRHGEIDWGPDRGREIV